MFDQLSLLLLVVVVNAVNELELIKHYIRKNSSMTASGWNGLIAYSKWGLTSTHITT